MAKNNIRIKFDKNGFAQLLNSEECHDLVMSYAEDIADRANANAGLTDSFKATSVKAPTRYIAFASSTDKASLIAESEDKALTRAIL
ncbi:MAG: hypothetical protein IIZ05_07360 [Firmicutes bacterium]|nr:hypothetical protein [Bacillota bacterium]